MFRTQLRNSMTEQFIHTLNDIGFELSMFREMVRSFEHCETMLIRKTENKLEKNAFVKYEKALNWGRYPYVLYYTIEVSWSG